VECELVGEDQSVCKETYVTAILSITIGLNPGMCSEKLAGCWAGTH
jgi:hypothetical protein